MQLARESLCAYSVLGLTPLLSFSLSSWKEEKPLQLLWMEMNCYDSSLIGSALSWVVILVVSAHEQTICYYICSQTTYIFFLNLIVTVSLPLWQEVFQASSSSSYKLNKDQTLFDGNRRRYCNFYLQICCRWCHYGLEVLQYSVNALF